MHQEAAASAIDQLELRPYREHFLEIDELHSIIKLLIKLAFSERVHFQSYFIQVNFLDLFVFLEVLLALHCFLRVDFELNLDILTLVFAYGVQMNILGCIVDLIHKHDFVVVFSTRLWTFVAAGVGIVSRLHIILFIQRLAAAQIPGLFLGVVDHVIDYLALFQLVHIDQVLLGRALTLLLPLQLHFLNALLLHKSFDRKGHVRFVHHHVGSDDLLVELRIQDGADVLNLALAFLMRLVVLLSVGVQYDALICQSLTEPSILFVGLWSLFNL